MTRNEWGVEAVHDGEGFAKWEWDSGDYGSAYAALVREISIDAAKVVLAELAKDVMPGLDADGMFSINAFNGTFYLQAPLDLMIADFIETHAVDGKIQEGEDREAPERLIAQLERAAALIRAAFA